MPLLPYVESTYKLVDGDYFHLLPFCKKKCSSQKCKEHYEMLNNVGAGSYRCPYGLSSYVYASPNGKIIFTGLRIKGTYDKKKAKVTETSECVHSFCRSGCGGLPRFG